MLSAENARWLERPGPPRVPALRPHARRLRAAGAVPRVRLTAAGALRPRSRRRPTRERHRRPRRRTCGATTSCCPSPRPEHVVTLGEGMTPAAPGAAAGRRARAAAAAGQGRGAAADRLLQGARRGRRRLPGPRAGRDPAGHADQRQRRRGLGRRTPPGPACTLTDRDAAGRAHDHPGRERRHRRRPAAGRRADLRRRAAGRRGRAGQRGRLVRRGDAQGALPDRGQEDDGLRDRRAARLADARRDRLPDRRRGRPDRHLQGARRGSSSWAGSPATLPRLVCVQSTGCAPIVRGLRGRRRRSREPVGGRARRSRSASTCPRRSATSWCSRRCARPAARRSRSTTPTCWPTWRWPRGWRGCSSAPRVRPP